MPPKILLCLGTAGTGKSTFVASYSQWLNLKNKRVYMINLDPACDELNYIPDLDIRDNISYVSVMKDCQMGPNGAIAVCLNMFSTKIDELCELLKTKTDYDVILIDTPGQIEVFTWSAAGTIILNGLQSYFGNDLHFLYLMDGRLLTKSSSNYILHVLHACGVLHSKAKNASIVVNKMDVVSPEQAVQLKSLTSSENATANSCDDYFGDLLQSIHEKLWVIWRELPGKWISCKTQKGFECI